MSGLLVVKVLYPARYNIGSVTWNESATNSLQNGRAE